MMVQGMLKCLHCGFVSGQWCGMSGRPFTVAGLKAGPGWTREVPREPNALVRCGRCNGSVFLDEPEAIASPSRLRRIQRMREQVAAMEARRSRRRVAA